MRVVGNARPSSTLRSRRPQHGWKLHAREPGDLGDARWQNSGGPVGEGDKPQGPPRPGVRQSGLLDPGRDYEFKIVKISMDQHKIGLSYRGAQKQAERRDMDDYRSTKSSAKATIGDAIMAKRSV